MKNIFTINSIKTRLRFWFFGVAILPLLIASVILYQQRTNSIKDEAFIKLTAIRDLKIRQINDWIKERSGDINVITDDLESMSLKNKNSEGRLYHLEKIKKTGKLLNAYVKNYLSWNDIFYFDAISHKIIYSSNPTKKELDRSTSDFITEVLSQKNVSTSNIHHSKSLGRPVMLFAKVVYDSRERNNIKGVVAAQVDLNSSLYNLLLDRSGMGSTGETLIVNKNRIALNELRWYKDAPLRLLIKAKPAVLASQGKIGITESNDYRNEPVLAAYGYIPNTQWGFVAKQDQSEVYSAIDGLIKGITIILAIALVAVFLISMFIANSIARPVLEMTQISKRLKQGDLSARNRISTDDELGFLSDNFNQMADSVESQVYIQKTVAELTEKLIVSNNMKVFSEILIKHLMKLTGSNLSAFYLKNRSNDQFEPLYSIGVVSDSLEAFDASKLEGEFGKVLVTKKISIIDDIPEDTIFRLKLSIGVALPKTIITIPIIIFGHVVAIVSLASIKKVSADQLKIIELVQLSINTIFANIEANEATKILASELEHKNVELKAQADEMKSQSSALSEQNQELDMQRTQVEAANRLKSEFLSNMSHELRTPLNSIMALSRILIRRTKDSLSEEESGFLEIISRNGKNLLSLINDILDLSKIEAGKTEFDAKQFKLSHTLQTILDSVRHIADEKGVQINSEIEESVPDITSDETRIHQILQNVIGNAIKFTETGSVDISVLSDTRYINIIVKDTGIGISEKALPFIFTEFRQADGSASRQFEGTGLGLAIAYKAAKLLGGNISVESQLDQGSKFTIRLPIKQSFTEHYSDNVLQETTVEPDLSSLNSNQKLILVVDDDPEAVQLISGFLQEEGYRTITADRGETALKLAEKYHPFAITLDTIMPEMDGWEVLQRIKENIKTENIPVIIISIADDKKTGFALGATGYITKPVARKTLVSEIHKVDCLTPHSILLVDDNEIELMEMKRMIESDQSMIAIPVNSGRKCLDYVDHSSPDVIILDLIMPEMNGFEVLKSLRSKESTKHIPVIISTAKDLSMQEQKLLQKQAESILTKQDSPDKLLKELKQFLLKLAPKTLPSGKSKILLVEDNESTIIQVTNILQEEGYQVDVARGGLEAIQFVQKSIPDGIILDLMMPEMNGFQVLETIRGTRATASIPVLILTAKDMTKEDLKQLSANNVQQLVQKGDVDPENLIFRIELMLGPKLNKEPTISMHEEESKHQVKAKVGRAMKKINSAKQSILIVEDNPDNMTTIKAILGDDYYIMEAFDGESGLNMVFENLPDLVLLDMSLPKMDGFSVVQKIKSNESVQNIPVIAITALAMKGEQEKILDAGCDDYISKPIDVDPFMDKIKIWLEKQGVYNG